MKRKDANHKSVNMQDVADTANTSIATVSRVINNSTSVNPHVRQKVLETIKALNYQIKFTSLRAKVIKIGLLIPDIKNPYFSILISGITAVSKLYDAEIILCNCDNNVENERYHFKKLFELGIDGIIYIPFAKEINSIVYDLIDRKFPIVFLDRKPNLKNICFVTSNNFEGSYQAVTYLINLGHRDIMFISGPSYLSTSFTRLEGCRKGLAEHKIKFNPAKIIYGDTYQKTAYKEVIKFIEKKKAHFTAVFASNDLMAFGAWQALEEKGYRIPDNVSIIGYDDIPFSSFASLTTVAQPGYEIGTNAILLLIDLIKGRIKPPKKIILRDSLIIRKSCKNIT